MRRLRYTVVFEKAEEGGYTVTVPSIPGVVTQGRTLREARKMATEAILCHLESLQKDRLPIPKENGVAAERVVVELGKR